MRHHVSLGRVSAAALAPLLLAATLALAVVPCDAHAQIRRGRGLFLARGRDGSTAPESAPRQTLRHDGLTRTYVLRVPTAASDRRSLLPLVLVLHGGGGNADNAERMFGWTSLGMREGFLVAYPEGTGRGRLPMYTWNARHCCGWAMQHAVDDVGFIDALIGQLQRQYPVDPARIYVTGMSNGGMMAHRLGIELSHRPAAVAPVVGAIFGDEPASRSPVSAIVFNGMVDQSVPYEGGKGGGVGARAWDGTPTQPAVQQGAFWSAADGCSRTPRSEDRGAYVVTSYDCPSSLDVVLYGMKQGGHAWPGGKRGTPMGDDPGASLDATRVIWDFFAAHPRR